MWQILGYQELNGETLSEQQQQKSMQREKNLNVKKLHIDTV